MEQPKEVQKQMSRPAYAVELPDILLFLCGDSEFDTPELLDKAENNKVNYAIRLK